MSAKPPADRSAAIAKRLLIIGLDGATWDVLGPRMREGRMPRLKAFIEAGVHGILDSTKPPITPAAWTTFMTGKHPGRHGILDFEKFDVFTNQVSFNSTYEIRERTIWEMLSDKGLRVGAINVPMTYPPRQVNGFMISGFETPSTEAEFTYPRELKADILKAIPDYDYRTNWRRRPGANATEVLQDNLDYIANSWEQGVKLVTLCGERYGWDAMMVVYKLVDNLQHKTWKHIDPRFNSGHPREAEMVYDCFAKLDVALGKLFDYADEHNALVMIMSDHGHGSLEGKAQANELLRKWGYLRLKNPFTRIATRLQHMTHRLLKGKKTRFEQGARGVERELAVDWSKTRACVTHAGIYGFLYLNLRGRGPVGVVEPADYERLRDEIADRLRNATAVDRNGRSFRIFPAVHKAEQLYSCSREERPEMPDLLLEPEPGLAVVRRIRGGSAVRWLSPDRIEGTHRYEGMYALGGPGVKPGAEIRANIADLTPTALAALGVGVPDDLDGRPLTEAFARPLQIRHEAAVVSERSATTEVYDDAERRLLEQRLVDLGYLE
ncbi:MAG: alkaline phosphatase family protein [Phycisphaerales bacterium]|nr:alkaline phosphatase family protein [Phycisphaerales bacterium]